MHVFQEDDLGITARVDSKGDINLNMVGEVHVAGQTLEEAEQAIEAAYMAGQFLRHPKVTLTVEELAPREVSVQGYVKNPGRYRPGDRDGDDPGRHHLQGRRASGHGLGNARQGDADHAGRQRHRSLRSTSTTS